MKKGRKKPILVLSALFLLLALFIIVYTFKSPPPQILSASVYPEKVMPGQVMIVTVQVKDTWGIKSATAIFDNEKMPDERNIPLITGTRRDGVYETRWIVHDTKAQGWYNTTIIFTNSLGKKSIQKIAWQDPSVSHKWSEITGKEFVEDNLMLLAFKIANETSLSKFNLEDGMMDAFEDETGVDTATSTNESYDSSNDIYQPSLTDVSEILYYNGDVNGRPVYGTGGTYEKIAQSFTLDESITCKKLVLRLLKGGSPTDNFIIRIETNNAGSPSGNLVDASATKTYACSTLAGSVADYTIEFPAAFSLSASTLYWIVMSRSGVRDTSNYPAWFGMDPGIYADGSWQPMASGSWVTAGQAGDHNFEVYKEQRADMTLVTNTYTSEAVPTSSRIVLFEEDVNAITVNTDLKGYISRDNGTSWTQATLTEEGNWSTNKRILSGTADISSQPSNTLMKWNVTTFNSKNLKLHGVGLLWE
jgi:hypothetical protein